MLHLSEMREIMSIRDQRRNGIISLEEMIQRERGNDDLPESQISINQTCQNIAKTLSNKDFSVNQGHYSTSDFKVKFQEFFHVFVYP